MLQAATFDLRLEANRSRLSLLLNVLPGSGNLDKLSMVNKDIVLVCGLLMWRTKSSLEFDRLCHLTN